MLKYNEYITEAKEIEHPFIKAAIQGSNNAIKKFIKEGVDKNMRSSTGKTALMLAVKNNFLMVVITLLENKVDVNLKDKDGNTALMLANTNKIIDKLLLAGADPNITNNYGETVIMRDLKHGYPTVEKIQKMLQYGLDLDIEDIGGRNFYVLLKNRLQYNTTDKKLFELEAYMDENFPKYINNDRFPNYRDEWLMKQKMTKYNI